MCERIGRVTNLKNFVCTYSEKSVQVKGKIKMALVRNCGKLGSSSIKKFLLNKNVYSNLRLLSSSSVLSSPPPALHKTTQIVNANAAPSPKIGRKDPLDTNFNDPIAAFKSKTTFELIRAYFVYLLCSSESLVEHNMKVVFFV